MKWTLATVATGFMSLLYMAIVPPSAGTGAAFGLGLIGAGTFCVVVFLYEEAHDD